MLERKIIDSERLFGTKMIGILFCIKYFLGREIHKMFEYINYEKKKNVTHLIFIFFIII